MTKSVLAFAALFLALASAAGRAIAQPDPVAPAAPAAAAAAAPAPAPAAIAPPSSAVPLPAPATFGPPSEEARPVARLQQPVYAQRLDETTALALSLGATVGTWGLFVAGAKDGHGGTALAGLLGTLVAPSAGHWYQGRGMTRGLAIRIITGGTGFLSFVTMIGCECSTPNAEKIFLGSVLLYIGATLDDIITAPLEVRKHNERIGAISLAPLVGNHTTGLALGGRF